MPVKSKYIVKKLIIKSKANYTASAKPFSTPNTKKTSLNNNISGNNHFNNNNNNIKLKDNDFNLNSACKGWRTSFSYP